MGAIYFTVHLVSICGLMQWFRSHDNISWFDPARKNHSKSRELFFMDPKHWLIGLFIHRMIAWLLRLDGWVGGHLRTRSWSAPSQTHRRTTVDASEPSPSLVRTVTPPAPPVYPYTTVKYRHSRTCPPRLQGGMMSRKFLSWMRVPTPRQLETGPGAEALNAKSIIIMQRYFSWIWRIFIVSGNYLHRGRWKSSPPPFLNL